MIVMPGPSIMRSRARLHHRDQLLARVAFKVLHVLNRVGRDRCGDEVVLVGEAAVDRRFADARRARDAVDDIPA